MIQERFAQYFLPVVVVVLLALVCVLAGLGVGWSQGVSHEQRKLAKERTTMASTLSEIQAEAAKWEQEVKIENARFGDAALQLAAARALLAQNGEITNVRIQTVASPVRQCISPATARVLGDAIARANERLAKAGDPGRAVALVPPASGVPDGAGAIVVELPAGVSEADTARYINQLVSQYMMAAEQHEVLIRRLKASPMVKVLPDDRSL